MFKNDLNGLKRVTYHSIVIFVEVVNRRDAPSISVWIVDMANVLCKVARIAGHHCFGPSGYLVLFELACLCLMIAATADQLIKGGHQQAH